MFATNYRTAQVDIVSVVCLSELEVGPQMKDMRHIEPFIVVLRTWAIARKSPTSPHIGLSADVVGSRTEFHENDKSGVEMPNMDY